MQTKRHWLYGFNTIVMVAIAVAILALAGYLTQRWRTHFDWTSGGLYSLSGATKALLKDVEAKQKSFELLSLYRPGTEQHQLVMDLLNEYARQSKAIKVADVSDVALDEVVRRIRTLYADELKPYETTITAFEPLADELMAFFKMEGANIGAAAQKPGVSPTAVREAQQLQGLFAEEIPQTVQRQQRAVRREMEATMPDLAKLADGLKPYMESMVQQFGIFTTDKELTERLSTEMVAYFQSARNRYEAMAVKMKAFHEQLQKLQPLKVQEILESIRERSIVVIGPTAVRVLSHEEIFRRQPGMGGGGGGDEEFTGEQAISSALLSLANPEKVKVVFVTVTPQRLTGPGGAFSDIITTLEQSNFEVLEWSPPSAMPNPQGPPPNPIPPAEGAGVVWVVFPPDPPNPQMMMMGMPPPDPRPVAIATQRHMEAGGQVMFLSEAESGMNAMMGMGGGYAYAGLLERFGVEVQSRFTVVQRFQRPGQDGELVDVVVPAVLIRQYPDTEITRPMQGLPTLFRYVSGQMGPMGMPTVVNATKELPPGASVKVLIETASGPDVWGESNFSEKLEKSTFDKGVDLASPVPMAVAATLEKGRIVVIGSKFFAMNPMSQDEVQIVLTGRGVRQVLRYPGGQELFRNSVLWLAGYENMIAVSAKASAALRIGEISPTTLTAIRLGFFYVGAPLAALLIGGIVWFVRRK